MRSETDLLTGLEDITLLRICAAPDGDHTQALSDLDAVQWERLVKLALEKRAGPLLRKAIGKLSGVPDTAAAALRASSQWHLHYGLKQQVAIGRLFDVLDGAGFQPIWLKGLSLSMVEYPETMLRPIRDVDLLLRPEDVLRAEALLLGHPQYRKAPWAGSYGMDYGHQMPEIQDTVFDLTIELHHRVNARGWLQETEFVEYMMDNAQTARVLGRPFRIPSPVANFLHLIEHATLHHMFENGPLILADLHYLARAHQLDWELVATQAERFGLRNSLNLVAAVARRLGATWLPPELGERTCCTPEQIDVACSAMLLSSDEVAQSKMLRRMDSAGQKQGWSSRAALFRALRPDPHELAKIVGCSATSSRRYLGYATWLWNRGRLYRSAISGKVAHSHASDEAALLQWIRQG